MFNLSKLWGSLQDCPPVHIGELLRHSDGIEVLQPQDLREKMRQMIVEMLKNY